mmetsp:Transcript_27020/g.71371  ORF Transcript_27020/g.71371 Transcript_27020/m.71371 type:complete len:365 (-) Transcript_27020:215-1309(-)
MGCARAPGAGGRGRLRLHRGARRQLLRGLPDPFRRGRCAGAPPFATLRPRRLRSPGPRRYWGSVQLAHRRPGPGAGRGGDTVGRGARRGSGAARRGGLREHGRGGGPLSRAVAHRRQVAYGVLGEASRGCAFGAHGGGGDPGCQRGGLVLRGRQLQPVGSAGHAAGRVHAGLAHSRGAVAEPQGRLVAGNPKQGLAAGVLPGDPLRGAGRRRRARAVRRGPKLRLVAERRGRGRLEGGVQPADGERPGQEDDLLVQGALAAPDPRGAPRARPEEVLHRGLVGRLEAAAGDGVERRRLRAHGAHRQGRCREVPGPHGGRLGRRALPGRAGHARPRLPRRAQRSQRLCARLQLAAGGGRGRRRGPL